MKHTLAVRKQTPSFRTMTLMLAIAPLCLAPAPTSAQTSNDVSTSTTTTSPAPSNWSQFLEDNMQRWNPNETILGVNTVGSLTELPSFELSEISGPSQLSSPAVVNGVVYVASIDGSLLALDASTGGTRWTYGAGSIVSSPAVANGVVYVGSENGNVYALSASTGAKLWTFTTGSSIESSATVANGVVYMGSDDHKVYALNASTGAKLWSFTTGDAAGGVGSSPAVANGVVYTSSADGHFYALNASTGAYQWSWAIDAPSASPAVANGVVYIAAQDGTIYALNAGTGARLWSFDTSTATTGGVFSSPAVANGVVYIGADKLYALNAGTGAQLWTFPSGGGSPAVANGVVYIAAQDSTIYALNAGTGELLWSHATTLQLSSPAISNGMLYVHDEGTAVDLPITSDGIQAFTLGADLFLRIFPTPTVHQGDLLTYTFPVWNLGPVNANQEVLMTQVPTGTTFDYIRISGTPGLGTCTTPPYQTIGQIVCHQNGSMAPNTTWTVRLTVKVTAPAGAIIFENGATLANNPTDPNMANNTASVRVTVQ
jgi:eukaryotic-like serine/threonine-protein kinase